MTSLTHFAAEGPHVSLAAEELFRLGGVSVTNAILLGIVGYGLLMWLLFYVAYIVRKNKKRNFAVKFVLWIYEALYNTVLAVIPDKKVARSVAPIPITLFFFIITQYYLGILPVVGPITYEGIPVFRGLAADLNTTFGLAILTLIVTQVYAIKVHGFFGNIGRYLRNPFKDPAGAFEGILEIVADFSRTVALSLRLFGNVFAGEVLLIMVAFFTSYLAVAALLPFYVFELFIGAIQAYIFFMLTTVFISLGLMSHDSHNPEHSPADDKSHASAAPARE